MRSILVFIIVAFATAAFLMSVAAAQSSTSSRLDAEKSKGEIKAQIKAAEGRTAIELMDKIAGWEQMLSDAKASGALLEDAIKRNSEAAQDFKKKASSSDMPKKRDFYAKKSAEFSTVADEMTLMLDELLNDIKILEGKVSAVKNDPEVKKIMEAEVLLNEALEKLKKADEMLPVK